MRSTTQAIRSLVIIDGSYFLYRAFYGLRPLTAPDGTPVGALFGFCRMIKKIIDTLRPDHLCIAWDSATMTHRKELYSNYKAQRQETPFEISHQRTLIQEFAQTIGIAQYSADGYEADDILYSISTDLQAHFDRIILVTADKDMAQMVNDTIVMYDAFTETFMGHQEVITKFGVPPERLRLYLALIGDSSDNIPGVSGIGPKAAQKLCATYATLDALYDDIHTIMPESVRKKLITGREQAVLSYALVQLKPVPFKVSAEQTAFDSHQWLLGRAFFHQWGFQSLLKELPPTQQTLTTSFAQEYGYTFALVQTVEELDRICSIIRAAGRCAVDTETTGGSVIDAQLVGISLCAHHGTAWYIPIGHRTDAPQIEWSALVSVLKPLLEDRSLTIICHNAQYDRIILEKIGIYMHVSFDTLIAAGLTTTSETERINLKALSTRVLNETMCSFKEVMATGHYTNFADVPLTVALDYAAADAHQTAQLEPILKAQLEQEQELTLFNSIEMPLIPLLAEMTQRGIPVDKEELRTSGHAIEKALQEVEDAIRTTAGPAAATINLNAPRQIEKLLFEELKLTPVKKTASGSYSTDSEVLEELAREHLIAQLLLTYRGLFKIKTTYIDTLPTFINQQTGRIHASFSQTATATGRLACSEPNLQNIPVDRYSGHSIRQAFKAPEGMQFISADYSQIELRVLAFLSQDATLVSAFLKDEDIHATTAAKIYQVPLDAVTHEQRQRGKRINFSILYGLTPYGLSRELAIPLKEAKIAIEAYFEHYPQVALWMNTVIESTKQTGYVTTHWGRRRYLPGIHEKNKNLYDLACRIAVNTVAQGTAAEIMKLGMIALDAHYKKTASGAEIMLQIHDELIIAAPSAVASAIAEQSKIILEQVVAWPIPLKVTTRIGSDWDAITK